MTFLLLTPGIPKSWAFVCRNYSVLLIAASMFLAPAHSAQARSRQVRLSSDLEVHLNSSATADVDVIITGPSELVDRVARRHGLRLKKVLSRGAVLSASRAALESLSADGEVASVSGNAVVRSHMANATAVTGAQAAWEGAIRSLGRVTGRGIGVAIIDSGIANHPALAGRVVASVDFTDPRGRGDDFYGHGTHIAGIVAARSFNHGVDGAESGMAPAAHLINLKVLGSDGTGEAADVIRAIDWAVDYREQFGIRVLNLSLGAAPTQSYKDDPICLAVERAVKAGLVVVVSAGNHGETADGKQVYGSVTSPGISPYAITVGALRTQGNLDPSDDEIAPWSSKGPTFVDHIVKPDLVAPGSKIVSAAVKGSALANLLADRFIDGPGRRDYVAMSGTSMAAAVVSGAVALLLDGDAGLRPLHVKLALQGSADFDSQAGLIAAGAGSLNLDGLKNVPHLQHALQSEFGFSLGVPSNGDSVSQVIIWGEVIVWGEVIIWGESIIDATAQGRVIIWGESLLDVIIWGESTIAQDVIIWGENANVIIWGEGADVIIWGETTDVIIWGESSDVIIWGESRLQLSSVQTNHLTQFDVSV